MEVKVDIPFEKLLSIVQQLPEPEKERLKTALERKQASPKSKSRLTEFLLNGPVFSSEQIKLIEENRNTINQWRTKPS